MLQNILETLWGKAHFMVMVGNKPAIELILEDKEIIIDIKNPILAIELGIEEFLENHRKGKVDISILDSIKKIGYKIKIKYKFLEFDL